MNEDKIALFLISIAELVFCKGRKKMGASDARLDDIARSAQILLSDRKKGGLYTAEQEAILNVRLFCVQFLTKVHKIVSMAYV